MQLLQRNHYIRLNNFLQFHFLPREKLALQLLQANEALQHQLLQVDGLVPPRHM